jgi:tRNA-splicing ligase RtcB
MITGQTLIDLGYKPSKWFKNVIDYANANQLDNHGIISYIESIVPKTIEPHKNPISFHQNILADNEHEQSNVDSVVSAMNSILTVPTAINAAIMPDACPTGPNDIPVGGIVVTKNAIHPSMHSADICCSMMATDLGFTDPRAVLEVAFKITHFGVGGRLNGLHHTLPSDLKEEIRQNYYLNSNRSLKYAQEHLATQGDGNHFLFVGIRQSDSHTIMVTHHGSRGFGANLYKEGLYKAQQFRQELSPNSNPKHPWIPFDTKEGRDYWEALQITRKWTRHNHAIIHTLVSHKVCQLHGDRFWNEHNFVFKKDDLFYHAKGATPLDDSFVPDSYNGLRLIPMNMRDGILIVKGETTETNLGFAPHGAGRNFSRTEHCKIKLQNKNGYELFEEETKGLDVRFFSGKIDISELPSAYKNADKIKNQISHFNLGTIVDEIKPYGCIMAGHSNKPWRKKKC